MHQQKLIEHEKDCMQNNQLPTEPMDELKDNSREDQYIEYYMFAFKDTHVMCLNPTPQFHSIKFKIAHGK